MAKSLSRIWGQIEKLQKEAAAIQNGAIARIRKEISDHGLTVEHLFGKSGDPTGGSGQTTKSASAKKSANKKNVGNGASKPPKFADGNGNVWGGMGKRPEWIRSALAAGRAIEEFLIGSKKPHITAKKPKAASKAPPKSTPKKVAKKTSSARAKTAPTTAKGARAATKALGAKTSQATKTARKNTKTIRKSPSKKTTIKIKQSAPATAQNASTAAV